MLPDLIIQSFACNDKDAEIIASRFTKETIKKGQYFVREGHYCNKLSFIGSGVLRIYSERGSKEITQWLSTAGYPCTELSSFLFGSVARWHIQAITDVAMFSITKEDYELLTTELPQWANIQRGFMAKCFLTLEDRVFSFLSKSAEERYNDLFASHADLFNTVPQQHIASMLGMTPETLSRIKAKRIS